MTRSVRLFRFWMGEQSRQVLLKAAVLIDVACSVLFALLVVHGHLLDSRYGRAMSLLRRRDPSTITGLAYVVGLSGVGATCVEFFACLLNTYVANRRRGNLFLGVFTVVDLILLAMALATEAVVWSRARSVETSLRDSLYAAMADYATLPNVKENFDVVQQEFQCCGVDNFTDWFDRAWSNPQFEDPKQDKTDSVPFSCCDPFVHRFCITFDVLGTEHESYDPRKDMTIHKRGCSSVLGSLLPSFLYHSLLWPLHCLYPLLLTMALLKRYVSTSVSDALKSGHPGLESFGYLVGWGTGDSEEVLKGVPKRALDRRRKQMLLIQKERKKFREWSKTVDQN